MGARGGLQLGGREGARGGNRRGDGGGGGMQQARHAYPVAPVAGLGTARAPGGATPEMRQRQAAREEAAGGGDGEARGAAGASIMQEADGFMRLVDDNFLPLLWTLCLFVCIFCTAFGTLMMYLDRRSSGFFKSFASWSLLLTLVMLACPAIPVFVRALKTESGLRKDKVLAFKSAGRRAWKFNAGWWDSADTKVRAMQGLPPREVGFRERLCV